MTRVQYLGQSPEDVDGFPTNIERTFSGALYLKPGRVYVLSVGEYAYIKKVRPELRFVEYKSKR